MSRFKEDAEKQNADHASHRESAVVNFMEGVSYTMSPLTTLRMIAAGSIFGEPSYYRPSKSGASYVQRNVAAAGLVVFPDEIMKAESTSVVFEAAVDSALSWDFKGTLDLAVSLRSEFLMRMNPAVIFIRAAIHPHRQDFNKENPAYMKDIGLRIIERPDDVTNQFEYWMHINKTKNKLPSIVKRTWATALRGFDRYRIHKYKGKSLIDLVRISHAHNEIIDELMKTGTVAVSSEEQTWETLRSVGKSWKEIQATTKIPHMALLRNIRGMFTETEDLEFARLIAAQLIEGVPYGKQFPFRYFTALKQLGSVNHLPVLKEALESCLDKAVENFPRLKGKVISLCDNSGSAWGAASSEYGSIVVAEIANLSGIITALQADEGYVGVFGDKLAVEAVTKRNGILGQLEKMNSLGRDQGGATENGIWLFFNSAIKNETHYDHIFIYSDMQAGHGGLFGIKPETYEKFRHRSTAYIDVLKLVMEYRKVVNPKVNIYSVQVAGYDNSLLPENYYRSTVLTGWTGKETLYAQELDKLWNQADAK